MLPIGGLDQFAYSPFESNLSKQHLCIFASYSRNFLEITKNIE
jgi:hypothetical protein